MSASLDKSRNDVDSERLEGQVVDRRGFLRKLAYGGAAVTAVAGGIAAGLRLHLENQKPPSLESVREPERSDFLTRQSMSLLTELASGRFSLRDGSPGMRPDGTRALLAEAKASLSDAPPLIDTQSISRLIDRGLEKRDGRDMVDNLYSWLSTLDSDWDGSVTTDEIRRIAATGPQRWQLLPRELEAFMTENWETLRTLVAVARLLRGEPYPIPESAAGEGGVMGMVSEAANSLGRARKP